ncbi:MAG: cupin domain-containing protein [Acidimicrobiales bacterium]
MHISKDQVPVKVDAPGATARLQTGFGEANGYGAIGAEYFSMATGTDLAPLLEGLDGDMCHSPHWGYLIEGEVLLTYTDGEEETCRGGELFYWPPGHSLRVTTDAEIVLFSPQAEHGTVVDHIREKVGGGV